MCVHGLSQCKTLCLTPKHVAAIHLPTVPRPPTGIVPNLLKGTENVTTLQEILRMTITSAGLAGISFDDMPADADESLVVVENGLSEM